MLKADFDKKYVGENLVVHCPTEESANEFLKEAHKHGYHWGNGDKYIDRNAYATYTVATCYRMVLGSYGSLEHYEDRGFEIVEFTGFPPESDFAHMVQLREDMADFFSHLTQLAKKYPELDIKASYIPAFDIVKSFVSLSDSESFYAQMVADKDGNVTFEIKSPYELK